MKQQMRDLYETNVAQGQGDLHLKMKSQIIQGLLLLV